ncbi:MAG TPA: aminotransferase class I/II-fold pyridoxal phosphate-dependent enzyme [Phycisphaerales bacterium]|nr:aminotransferase class I/II-fold pyridoxal phosphate-dependent enzyme [Phycisphaerales bacterium]
MTPATRFAPFGSSIFAEMTRLALAHNAVNLSQGFPDFDGPELAKAAAKAAIDNGYNQYARMQGVPALNEAIARSWSQRGHGDYDPHACVTVTSGCSEAIICALMGLLNPGDELVIFEPFFDFYTAGASMAGANPRFVPLRPDASGFHFDEKELRRAFTTRTRAIIVNSPHNPTGKVFTRAELELIAELCRKHNAVAITDEVYEHLTYNPALPHIPLSTLPGMRERTITLSSIGKTFSLTGWKVGWAIAQEPLTACVRACHQFNTFSTATPLQHGAAAAISNPGDTIEKTRTLYIQMRDQLSAALTRAGLTVYPSDATYFLMADHTPVSQRLGLADDRAFCKHLIEHVGVAAIPPSVFYHNTDLGKPLVRFAFCKKPDTIAEAIRRLDKLRA